MCVPVRVTVWKCALSFCSKTTAHIAVPSGIRNQTQRISASPSFKLPIAFALRSASLRSKSAMMARLACQKMAHICFWVWPVFVCQSVCRFVGLFVCLVCLVCLFVCFCSFVCLQFECVPACLCACVPACLRACVRVCCVQEQTKASAVSQNVKPRSIP